MKIGLAVCYDTKNFGSQLQVLATIRMLEKLGHEPEIIQYKKKVSPIFIAQTLPRLFNISFVRNKLQIRHKVHEIQKHPEIAEKVQIRNRRFEGFVDKYFTAYLRPFCGWESLVKESGALYDAFLCGSDQLWLPSNLGSHFYTLEFAPDWKDKISYATSFGVSSIPWYQKNRTAGYLKRFHALSTREVVGAKIIENLTGRAGHVVCDPTLLFDAEEWLGIIHDENIISEPYIFCYFLGASSEHREAALKFKKETDLKLVTCPFLDNYVESDRNFGDLQMFDMDSSDFVNLIRHADYILTDSFHGSVFSILNHKKFLTFDRFKAGTNSRNSRIDSLCTLLGLNERRYTGEVTKVISQIDYAAVDSKLLALRTDSISFLNDAIKDLG